MTNALSPAQFSPRDQTLPGMPFPVAKARAATPPRPSVDRPTPALLAKSRTPKTKPNWTGIAPGQTVMGVHDLGNEGFERKDGSVGYEADRHGFVHEPKRPIPGPTSLAKRPKPMAPADEAGDQVDSRLYYGSIGGKYHRDQAVQDHWDAQPLHEVRSDAIIHTAQHWQHETESGNNPMTNEGRKRINTIREDLASGNPMQKPAWLMKSNNRLYALDGHHRMVAAREAGLASFPARIWDRDSAE